MAVQIEYHPRFWEDVEAQALYLEKEAALGVEFLDKVDEAIASVKSMPEAHSCLYDNTRNIILNKFRRHTIHFEYFDDANLIRVYALFHGSENPSKWLDRTLKS